MGFISIICESDAEMAREAFDFAKEKAVVLKTNSKASMMLLCKLIYNNQISYGENHIQLENIYLERANLIYDCNELVRKIPRATSSAILLAHAFCGSNATSAIHGVGPAKTLKPGKITPDILDVFYNPKSEKDEIVKKGIILMTRLYSMDVQAGWQFLRKSP